MSSSSKKINKSSFKTKSQKRDRNKLLFSNLLTKLAKVLAWLESSYKKDVYPGHTKVMVCLIGKVRKILENRGPIEALTYVKETRRILSCYLSGNKETHPKIKCTVDGIPQVLGDLIPVIRRKDAETFSCLPLLYTVLTSTRSLSFGRIPDIKPITDEITQPKGCVDFISYNAKYMRDFWTELGYRSSTTRVPKRVQWKSFHLTTKSGPNGHALFTSLQDLYSLPENLVESIKVVGGQKITSHIDSLLRAEPRLENLSFPIKKGAIRRITHFPDKEMKVRVIAVLDYWSQTVLKPLHDYLNKVLSRIPQDCTYDQGSFMKKLDKAKVLYSVDLTAATDRFPMDLICSLLKAKFPHSYVDHWRNIMIGYPFDNKIVKDKIFYKVGNPMGAYSSWCSFSVAHHFVVYSCIRELNLKWRDIPYCLLGDDIVIGHKEVADLYISKIRSLGVEISDAKSHISTDFCEFAKRLTYKGREITPFPISALAESEKRCYLLAFLIQDCEKKGWIHVDDTPSLVSKYYEFILKYRSRRRKDMRKFSMLTLYVNSLTRDPETAYSRLGTIIWRLGYPVPFKWMDEDGQIRNDVTSLILSQTVLEVYRQARRQFGEKFVDADSLFGSAIIKFRTELDQRRNFDTYGSDDLKDEHFPVICVYTQILEKVSLIKSRLTLKSLPKGTWKEMLEITLLPVGDDVFTQRLQHRQAAACTTIGKILEKVILACEEQGRNFWRIPLPSDSPTHRA